MSDVVELLYPSCEGGACLGSVSAADRVAWRLPGMQDDISAHGGELELPPFVNVRSDVPPSDATRPCSRGFGEECGSGRHAAGLDARVTPARLACGHKRDLGGWRFPTTSRPLRDTLPHCPYARR